MRCDSVSSTHNSNNPVTQNGIVTKKERKKAPVDRSCRCFFKKLYFGIKLLLAR